MSSRSRTASKIFERLAQRERLGADSMPQPLCDLRALVSSGYGLAHGSGVG
jgi:hypothetical protein